MENNSKRRMYAFSTYRDDMKETRVHGISFYFVDSQGKIYNPIFFLEPVSERVRYVSEVTKGIGINEIYTSQNVAGLKFGDTFPRTQLMEEEILAFAKRGLKVITLDKIS